MRRIGTGKRAVGVTVFLLGTVGVAIGYFVFLGTRRHHVPVHMLNGNPIDLGEHLSFGKAYAQIELRNDSKHAQVLDSLRDYWGCLVFDAGQLPRSIAPGATCRVDVTVPLDHFPEEGRITLSFDAFFSGYRDPLKVTLSVEKVLPLPRVIDLGAFIGSTTKDIELREVGRRAGLKIAGVTCSDPCLRVAMRTPTTFRITVDSVPVGEPIEAFADVTFDGGSIARQRVSIQGMASGGLLVHPNPLVFGHVRISNGPLTKEVRIDSDDGKPFSLSAGSFDQDQELFSIRVTAESDTRTVCHITVHPRRPGALDEVVKLMTTDGQRGVSIRCVGMIE